MRGNKWKKKKNDAEVGGLANPELTKPGFLFLGVEMKIGPPISTGF